MSYLFNKTLQQGCQRSDSADWMFLAKKSKIKCDLIYFCQFRGF